MIDYDCYFVRMAEKLSQSEGEIKQKCKRKISKS